MNDERIVLRDPMAVDGRLEELGLSREILAASLKEAEAHRAECTENDPPTAPGIIFWAKAVRALRDNLIPNGWTRSEEARLSTVVSPGRERAIAVSAGDEHTGIEGADPKTKYGKGPAAKAAIDANRSNLQMPLFEFSIVPKIPPANRPLTYWLLFRRNGASLRWELSLPLEWDETARLHAWRERLIFEELTFDTAIEIEEEPTPEDIDFTIDVTEK